MTEYLTREQRAELERQLGEGLTEEQAQAAMAEGARMAQADMKGGMQEGGNVLVLDEEDREFMKAHGFMNMKEVMRGFDWLHGVIDRQRELLQEFRDMEKAEDTAAALDVRHPEYAIRRRIEMELRPMRDKARAAARNRMIQQDWLASAAGMRNLERMLPEMAEYIMAHPRFAEDSEGLMRAYEAVRSGKYRDEEELMDDPDFIERMAGNELVKEAVLRAHMEEIRKGGGVPQSVGAMNEAGKTPLTGRKPITGMEMAKKRLEAMLR